jgi:hypothetical protein
VCSYGPAGAGLACRVKIDASSHGPRRGCGGPGIWEISGLRFYFTFCVKHPSKEALAKWWVECDFSECVETLNPLLTNVLTEVIFELRFRIPQHFAIPRCLYFVIFSLFRRSLCFRKVRWRPPLCRWRRNGIPPRS